METILTIHSVQVRVMHIEPITYMTYREMFRNGHRKLRCLHTVWLVAVAHQHMQKVTESLYGKAAIAIQQQAIITTTLLERDLLFYCTHNDTFRLSVIRLSLRQWGRRDLSHIIIPPEGPSFRGNYYILHPKNTLVLSQ